MGVKFEVVAAGEKYQSNGQEKTRWIKMGVVLQRSDESLWIKLESVPVGWNGIANLWEPKERSDARPQQPRQASASIADIESDIPF